MAELLERDGQLAVLRDCIDAVKSSSRGRLVLVGGEAGVGKTALLRRVCDDPPTGGRVLWGACDALITPRALGPFLDIAESTGGELEELVETGAGAFDVAAALMRELRTRSHDPRARGRALGGRRDARCAANGGPAGRNAARGHAGQLSRDRAGPVPPAAAGARRAWRRRVDRAREDRAAFSGGGRPPRRAAWRGRRRPARANGRQPVLRHRGARGRRGRAG